MFPSSNHPDLLAGVAQFGQFILENWQRITRHWVTTVDRSPEVPASDDLTYRQLVDHLPELCHELGSILKRPDVPAIRDQATRDAGAHGRKRWQQGYNLAQLIREICLIRNDVIDVWLEVFERECNPFDREARGLICKMVQRFFDDLIIESTVQFASEQIAEAQTIHAALLEAETAADSAKAEVLRHVSHTLREPLAAMNFAAAALNAEKNLSPEARHSLHVILRNIKVQAQNVNELLVAAQMTLSPNDKAEMSSLPPA
jgi:signal transduction histidine kinase